MKSLFPRNALLVLLIGIAGSGIVAFAAWNTYKNGHATPAAYAEEVLYKCRADSFPPACYDKEIPKLMDFISMEEAFEVTRLVQAEDDRYLYCHVLGHELSAREAKKDPRAWKDVVTRCPATMCNNGCLHGALMERFQSESLSDSQIKEIMPDLHDVCEPRGSWNPAEVERSMCYHAIGHLHMYITNADPQKASKLCEAVGQKADGRNYVQTCTEGVFMQIFQPLEPEDVALVKDIAPTRETVADFCRPFKHLGWNACQRESWPLFREEIHSPAGLANFCSYAEHPTEERACYSASLNMITVTFMVERNDLPGMTEYCRALPGKERQSQCFANVATRLVQIDPKYTGRAVKVCGEAERTMLGDECYRDLAYYAAFSFHRNSPEFRAYCEKLPESKRSECLKT